MDQENNINSRPVKDLNWLRFGHFFFNMNRHFKVEWDNDYLAMEEIYNWMVATANINNDAWFKEPQWMREFPREVETSITRGLRCAKITQDHALWHLLDEKSKSEHNINANYLMWYGRINQTFAEGKTVLVHHFGPLGERKQREFLSKFEESNEVYRNFLEARRGQPKQEIRWNAEMYCNIM